MIIYLYKRTKFRIISLLRRYCSSSVFQCFVALFSSGHVRMTLNLGVYVCSVKMSGQQSADYVVGQVSGSLFQKNAAASASPLSALFGSAPPATALVFLPPPKVSSSTAPPVCFQKTHGRLKCPAFC